MLDVSVAVTAALCCPVKINTDSAFAVKSANRTPGITGTPTLCQSMPQGDMTAIKDSANRHHGGFYEY